MASQNNLDNQLVYRTAMVNACNWMFMVDVDVISYNSVRILNQGIER